MSSVSTGWRTASTVIIIIVGAVLITFAVFIYRRRKTWREGSNAPEMQQRYMDSFAGDPEAHTPLLIPPDGAGMPPIPPKTEPFAHDRSTSSLGGLTHHRNGSSIGGLGELGDATRSRPSRVPVPPMFPQPSVVSDHRPSFHDEHKPPPVSFPVPETASSNKSPLFPFPQIQFPRIQIKSDGKKGRLPSLRIEFQRESNQVVSSPGVAYPNLPTKDTPPASTISAPSTNSRPFATMASSPLPHIPRISPINITRQSPSTASPPHSSANSVMQVEEPSSPASAQDVGRGLFTRKLSTEDSSTYTISRNSSARPVSDPVRPHTRTLSSASRSSIALSRGGSAVGSASGSSSSGGTGLKRATTWVPNVMASYSPWHGVLARNGQAKDKEGEKPESPTGELRLPEGYRPMPTLAETPEVTPATIPSSLPSPVTPYANIPSPSYVPEDAAKLAQAPLPPSPSSHSEDLLPLPPQLAAMPSPSSVERLPSPNAAAFPLPPSPSPSSNS
ncbi:hypothetical protein C8Q76DRAFT_709061 [Earliella scabrosa]|nr:hypothetical protein C8Q76DRAFT_709061 [Earliella scabrosa]